MVGIAVCWMGMLTLFKLGWDGIMYLPLVHPNKRGPIVRKQAIAAKHSSR